MEEALPDPEGEGDGSIGDQEMRRPWNSSDQTQMDMGHLGAALPQQGWLKEGLREQRRRVGDDPKGAP